MKLLPSLLRTTSLSLLLACTAAPSLVCAVDTGIDEICGISPSAVSKAPVSASLKEEPQVASESYFQYFKRKAGDLATQAGELVSKVGKSIPDSAKDLVSDNSQAFTNGLIKNCAQEIENFVHNLVVHYGGQLGQEAIVFLHDKLGESATKFIINQLINKGISISVKAPMMAFCPAAGAVLNNTWGGDTVVVGPLQRKTREMFDPATKKIASFVANVAKGPVAAIGKAVGEISGEIAVDQLFKDGELRDLLLVNLTTDRVASKPVKLSESAAKEINEVNAAYNESRKTWGSWFTSTAKNAWTSVTDIGYSLTHNYTTRLAKKNGAKAAKELIAGLDKFGKKIGFTNKSLARDNKEISITAGKKRNSLRKAANDFLDAGSDGVGALVRLLAPSFDL